MPYDKEGKFIPNDNFVCKRAGIEQKPPVDIRRDEKPKKK